MAVSYEGDPKNKTLGGENRSESCRNIAACAAVLWFNTGDPRSLYHSRVGLAKNEGCDSSKMLMFIVYCKKLGVSDPFSFSPSVKIVKMKTGWVVFFSYVEISFPKNFASSKFHLYNKNFS